MKRCKHFLKKIIPLTISLFEKKAGELFAHTEAVLNSKIDSLIKLETKNSIKLEELIGLQHRMNGHAAEAVWADVYHDTIQGSEWLKNAGVSPGRWAVGYPLLYVLYRVLDELRPKSILELGLGQSSRMIFQYVRDFTDTEYFVVETDPDWAKFFLRDKDFSLASHVILMDIVMKQYAEAENVRCIKDFGQRFVGKKFELLLIDAPLGGDMKEYARVDVIEILPDALAESFVIILDDTNRKGETRTAQEISRKLSESGIEFRTGSYAGEKKLTVWCSKNNRFICTL